MDPNPDVYTAIREVGVPAALLVIVLLRIEPKLDSVIRAVESLTDAVQLHVVSQVRLRPTDPKDRPRP